MNTKHRFESLKSESKINSNLPNWISWDKSQGKYVLFFEEYDNGVVLQ